jgi:5-methylcytosine-specific restriction endonuclease McrA
MPSSLQRSRALAFTRQGGRCFYCGVAMWLGEPTGVPSLRCTAEHLQPRSEGGSDRPDNIVAACAHCNHARHKRRQPPEPSAYRAEVMRRISRGRWHPRWVFERGLVGH